MNTAPAIPTTRRVTRYLVHAYQTLSALLDHANEPMPIESRALLQDARITLRKAMLGCTIDWTGAPPTVLATTSAPLATGLISPRAAEMLKETYGRLWWLLQETDDQISVEPLGHIEEATRLLADALAIAKVTPLVEGSGR